LKSNCKGHIKILALKLPLPDSELVSCYLTDLSGNWDAYVMSRGESVMSGTKREAVWWVQAGSFAGLVQDIGYLQTKILGFDGVPILVPNQAFINQVWLVCNAHALTIWQGV
jgi:hypothetical protein